MHALHAAGQHEEIHVKLLGEDAQGPRVARRLHRKQDLVERAVGSGPVPAQQFLPSAIEPKLDARSKRERTLKRAIDEWLGTGTVSHRREAGSELHGSLALSDGVAGATEAQQCFFEQRLGLLNIPAVPCRDAEKVGQLRAAAHFRRERGDPATHGVDCSVLQREVPSFLNEGCRLVPGFRGHQVADGSVRVWLGGRCATVQGSHAFRAKLLNEPLVEEAPKKLMEAERGSPGIERQDKEVAPVERGEERTRIGPSGELVAAS